MEAAAEPSDDCESLHTGSEEGGVASRRHRVAEADAPVRPGHNRPPLPAPAPHCLQVAFLTHGGSQTPAHTGHGLWEGAVCAHAGKDTAWAPMGPR